MTISMLGRVTGYFPSRHQCLGRVSLAGKVSAATPSLPPSVATRILVPNVRLWTIIVRPTTNPPSQPPTFPPLSTSSGPILIPVSAYAATRIRGNIRFSFFFLFTRPKQNNRALTTRDTSPTGNLVDFSQLKKATRNQATMSGGKGKSHGGKAGHKAGAEGRTQVSHSAKAGLQVGFPPLCRPALDGFRA